MGEQCGAEGKRQPRFLQSPFCFAGILAPENYERKMQILALGRHSVRL